MALDMKDAVFKVKPHNYPKANHVLTTTETQILPG